MTLQGRRRPDTSQDSLPDDIQAGDYWKVLDGDSGEPIRITNAPGNLTGGCWMVVAPMPDGAFGIGQLRLHTVREEEDGTISVRPGRVQQLDPNARASGQVVPRLYRKGVWRDA